MKANFCRYFGHFFLLHILTSLFGCFTLHHLGYASIDFQSRVFSLHDADNLAFPDPTASARLLTQSKNFRISKEYRKNPHLDSLSDRCRDFRDSSPYSRQCRLHMQLLVGHCRLPYFQLCYRIHVPLRSSSSSSTTRLWTSNSPLFTPNDLLLALLFFLFVVSFCGVMVPAQQLPSF